MIIQQAPTTPEAYTRNLLAHLSVPALTWLSEDDPVRQLVLRVNPQSQPGSVLDVLTMSYIAPVECLNAFIALLEKAKWGEFWETYFERMIPRDVLRSYGAVIGCKAAAKYLREESVAGLGNDALAQLQANAKRLMTPLADEIYALSVFFKQTQAITQPQRGPQVSHEQLLGRRVMMGSTIPPSSQAPVVMAESSDVPRTLAEVVAAAQGTAINENQSKPDLFQEDLPYHIPALLRGYSDVRTDHLAQALLNTQVDWATLVSSMPHTWPLSPEESRKLCNFNTLAKVLLEIKRIGDLGALRTETDLKMLDALTKGLFMNEAYLPVVSDPQLDTGHIATALWGLVVSCGYDFYKPERRCATAAGWKVRGTLFARVVLGDYIGEAACPLLNSNKGNITRYGVTPQDSCWDLGYFPQVLAGLTK